MGDYDNHYSGQLWRRLGRRPGHVYPHMRRTPLAHRRVLGAPTALNTGNAGRRLPPGAGTPA